MRRGIRLAFVYVGLVIGAGFASGREILEYFNRPAKGGSGGVILAGLLLMTVCWLILRRASLWNLCSSREYLDAVAGKGAPLVRLLMTLYLFCGFFTMLAGSGALLEQTLMLPPIAGILLLALLCFLVLVFEVRGIVTLNLILTPCMIAGIVYICFSAAVFGNRAAFSLQGLARGTLASAVCYVSYNTISAAPVLVPLSRNLSPGEIRTAAIGGGLVLGLLILAIWLCQGLHLEALWDTQLPMLKLAAMAGRLQRRLYALVLFMAICTTAVSQGFGLLESLGPKGFGQRARAAGLLCLLAIPFSLLGFSRLVSHLYAFFGAAGLLWMAWLAVDFYRSRKP